MTTRCGAFDYFTGTGTGMGVGAGGTKGGIMCPGCGKYGLA